MALASCDCRPDKKVLAQKAFKGTAKADGLRHRATLADY